MNCPNNHGVMSIRETESHIYHECSVCQYSMSDKKYVAIGKPKTENMLHVQTGNIKELLLKMQDEEFANRFSMLMQNTMKHFHQYSIRNMFWIMWQLLSSGREASLINSATRWKILGRKVKAEEVDKGLLILRPQPKGYKYIDSNGVEQVKSWTSFVSAKVYDYQQTEGKEIVMDNKSIMVENPEQVYNSIVSKLESKGFTVTVKPVDSLTKGGGIDKTKKITLSSFRSVSNHICTLLHEYAHFICGHLEEKFDYSENREQAEIEAELSAFIFGMSIGAMKGSYEYIANWTEGDFDKINDKIVSVALKTANTMKAELKLSKDETAE